MSNFTKFLSWSEMEALFPTDAAQLSREPFNGQLAHRINIALHYIGSPRVYALLCAEATIP